MVLFITGISSVSKDDLFYRIIPATYIKEIAQLNKERDAITNSVPYRIGVLLHKVMKKTGLIKILHILLRR